MTIETLWENIKRWSTLRPFGNDITVLHILIVLLVLYIGLTIARKFVFSSLDKDAIALKPMSCTSCGWQGKLQVAIRQCPHCSKHTMRRDD